MAHQHHRHDHGHAHAAPLGGLGHSRAFAIGIVLNVAFVAIEVIYGIGAGSSALLADAGHNTSDVLSLAFAWGAAWLAGRRPSHEFTYGYRRTTILVSILNALLIFGAVILIGLEAIDKLKHPTPVTTGTVMWVAGIGTLINAVTALLFMKGRQSDLNIRGAFLHMAADAAVSLGVVIGGWLIQLTGKTWIDPVLSFIIILVILHSSWNLLTASVKLALDAVPENIKLDEVKRFLLSVKGVEDVHDLHIWAMSTTQTALTAHLVAPGEHDDSFLFSIREQLGERFGIGHTTLQIERSMTDRECQPHCV